MLLPIKRTDLQDVWGEKENLLPLQSFWIGHRKEEGCGKCLIVCPLARQRAPPVKTKSLKDKKKKQSGRKSSDAESLIYF